MLLFEDKEIVVCLKPAGVLSQQGEGENMPDLLSEGGKREIFPVHRLDRETGGIMVFAKTSRAAAELSKQITENKLKKRYFAVIKGCPDEKSGVLEDLLYRDKQKNKTFIVKRMRKGVRDAKLEYTVRDEKEGLSLISVLLHTGRTHQIRVQFSGRKMPLYGDGRYGGGGGELALFACGLSFEHPASGEKMKFSALPDREKYPWSLFEANVYSEKED